MSKGLFALLAAVALLTPSMSRAEEPIVKVNPTVSAGKARANDRASRQFDNYMSGRKVQGSTGPIAPPKPPQSDTHK